MGESADRTSAELARRYGEVARLLIDAGMIVISTTNPFGSEHEEAAEAIRTLVYPAPVISVRMSKDQDEPAAEANLTFTGPGDFDAAARAVIEELKRTGIVAHAIGDQPTFHSSI